MLKRLLFVMVLLLVLTVSVGAQAAPTWTPGPCPFPDIERVSCGVVTVPESRDGSSAGQVELMVAVIAAQNGNPLPDPIIYLEGGPGGAAIMAIEEMVNHPFAADRNIIVFDQRGTGFSLPSLNCPEIEWGESDDPVAECYERLTSEGINLSAYNSTENAADVNDVRIALGYDTVNLWGISYGTRLSLEVIRDYPQTLRSVVIDSVYPAEINTLETTVADSTRAFDYLFEACAADPVCASEYPDIENTFYDMLLRFYDEPPMFEYDDGEEVYDIELYPEDILNAMFQTMYASDIVKMLPYGITMMANAQDDYDYADSYDILQGYYTPESWENWEEEAPRGGESVMESDMVLDYMDEYGDISDSEGMFNSVTCAEETPFENMDVALAAVETAPDALYDWLLFSVEGSFFDCDTWIVEQADAVQTQRVTGDVPTLLISGGFDPVTPPSYGDSAAAGLSNGTHVVFPFGSHGDTAPADSCATQIATAFYANPAAPVDTSCVPQTYDWYVEQ